MGPGCMGSDGKCTYDVEKVGLLFILTILVTVCFFFIRTNLPCVVKTVVYFDGI